MFCCGRSVPAAAHTCAALRTYPRQQWLLGGVRRASGTWTCLARCDSKAPVAAHTCTDRSTPQNWQWQVGKVTLHELCGDVLGLLRSKRAGCCARLGHLAHIPPQAVADGGFPVC